MSDALGVPVIPHDDNSKPAMHDLRVVYPDRDPAPVEVTTAADPWALALWQKLQPFGRWIEDELAIRPSKLAGTPGMLWFRGHKL